MTMRQLQSPAVLAIPATVRPLLFDWLYPPPTLALLRRYSSAKKYANIAAFSIPEFHQIESPKALSPQDIYANSALTKPSSSTRSLPIEDEINNLFTKNPAEYTHGNLNFYHLRKNTRTPEVCILGRSNVGKSSLVNALANRRGSPLAFVSKKAGRTRTINSYGFGPAPSPKDIPHGREYKGKEDFPTHSFYLVDLPGYGHGSLKDWGRNIELYLTKRSIVKGAILLIDCRAGPKETDWKALQVLVEAGLRTTIIITKADKAGSPERLQKVCEEVWGGLLFLETNAGKTGWTWEKEMFISAAGANDKEFSDSTLNTTRLAVARIAGLVKDTRPKETKDKKWSGKIVSFDELNLSDEPLPDKAFQPPPEAEIDDDYSDSGKAVTTSSGSYEPSPALANVANQWRNTPSDEFQRRKRRPIIQTGRQTGPRSRFYSTVFIPSKPLLQSDNKSATTPNPTNPDAATKIALEEFMDSLQSSGSSAADEQRRRLTSFNRRQAQVASLLTGTPLSRMQARAEVQTRSLQEEFPDIAQRTRDLHDERLVKEVERRLADQETQRRRERENAINRAMWRQAGNEDYQDLTSGKKKLKERALARRANNASSGGGLNNSFVPYRSFEQEQWENEKREAERREQEEWEREERRMLEEDDDDEFEFEGRKMEEEGKGEDDNGDQVDVSSKKSAGKKGGKAKKAKGAKKSSGSV